MKDLEVRFNKLREFNETLNESTDEDLVDMTEKTKYAFKYGTIELVANQIYDKLTILLNNTRKKFDIQKGRPIDSIGNYSNFKPADDGTLSYIYRRTVINLGNINDRLIPPWEMHRLSVTKLKSMGFRGIMDEDVNPYKQKYKKAREKVRILNEDLNEKIKSNRVFIYN